LKAEKSERLLVSISLIRWELTKKKSFLSSQYRSKGDIMENGTAASEAEGVEFIAFENGETIFELESGNYEFTMPWQTLYEDVIRMNPFQLESQDD
jgi:hypothetical protein